MKEYTGYVNPFIGTGGHGHTHPGAMLPHGMIQPGPDTRIDGWDSCSGYYYEDSTINGFAHTRLSGTGCADFGDFLLMPTVGEQKVEYQYDDVNRIYFQYEVLNSLGNKVSLDSVVFSFGKLSDDVGADTAKIVVRVLGNTSEEPRTYRVKVLEKGNYLNGETNMVADEDYVSLAEEQLFGPGRFQDTLRIVVFRKNLSKSLRNPESKTLMLTLVAGGDFQLGIEDGREMKLSVNDILFPPAWWTANEGELGFYHPKKWRKLIELDPIFAIEDAFVGTGVDMTKKSQILREWLNKNIIIDDETGMRIMMDGLVEITDLN